MEQREIDNMLLSMIQKHFPSLPLSDEYTDWGKWLCFARAVYEAGRASPASAPEGWKHSCNALCLDGVELWIPQCPHCGKPAPTPPVSEDRKDAERYRWLVDNSFDKGITQLNIWKHTWEPHSQTGESTEWKQRIRGPSLDAVIDAAMQEDKKP